jgi:flagellar hook-length control protein FliK
LSPIATTTPATTTPASTTPVSITPAGITPAGITPCGTAASTEGATAAVIPQNNALIQDLISLLPQGSAGDTTSASADLVRADASANAAAIAPQVDANAVAGTAAPAAHMSVASHFALQHPNSDAGGITADLRAPVGTPAWNDELGGQLTWMAHQGIESASLHLSPEHLGPLEIRISVREGDASVWFGATQADTRTALEQALPRLRELFATQGLTLADAGVSREPPRGQSKSNLPRGIAPVSGVGSDELSIAARVRLGLVDTYA